MNSVQKIIFLIAGAVILTAFVCQGISSRARLSMATARAGHQDAVTDRQRQWARDRVDREVTTLQQTRERQRRHENEFAKALGGPAAAAAKNPDLSITDSIQQLARACAPKGAGINVTVNRFTEFSALIELPVALNDDAVAALAQCILNHSSDYLYELQINQGGRLLAELGRREIESIPNWSNATLSQIRRLIASATENRYEVAVREIPAQTKEPDTQENLTPEMRRQKEASDAFLASIRIAEKNLNTAINTVQNALNMAGVRRVSELTQKAAILQQSDSLAQQARAVLEDPAAEYRRILAIAALDPVYVQATLRGTAAQFQSTQPLTARMFAQHREYLKTAADYLDALAANFTNWTYDPAAQMYRFTSDSAHRDIKASMDRFAQQSETLNAAVKAWSDGLTASFASRK